MDSAPEPIPGDHFADNDLPSCEGCRRRKLKCSRQKPLCTNCEKYDTPCVYEPRKQKPGLKTGAVDALSRRLEFIENFLFNPENNEDGVAIPRPGIPTPSAQPQPQPHSHSQDSEADSTPVLQILTSLASEIQKLNSNISTNIPAASTRQTDETHTPGSRDDHHQPHKRRRIIENGRDHTNSIAESIDDQETGTLPTDDILGAMLDFYFPHIQPWLPLIHEMRFRGAIETAEGRLRNEVVLHAMVVACTRHLVPEEHNSTKEQLCRMRKISRDHVVRTAMSGLCVENLQALAILAFTDIGNGECTHAWPVIGSLTRSVQYLQLSVESEDVQKRTSFLKSLPSLPEPKNWTEEEERRRVFWNVFILDRFCSVTTGWNTSLTAADVSKRLPVCGGKWYNETPAATPYFGIWSHSSASLGKSITFLPSHYASPAKSATTDTTAPDTPGLPRPRSKAEGTLDVSNIGAFAYYIESIESLSRVNTYFLQQNINFTDRHEVLSWLTRFKELDLRLVHWKMFLPHQWKDSGTSRETMPGVMDPNMTAANATHNASMILLHQKIAYPGPELSGIKLPSACSAETCLSAAIENANISSQFLDQSSGDVLATPQLGFCLFISASVLLMHWRFLRGELTPEFWTMILNLEDMSRRWTGPGTVERTPTVFSQFATRLRKLHQKCLDNPNFPSDLLDLGNESGPDDAIAAYGYREYSHPENIYPTGTVPNVSMSATAWVSSEPGRGVDDLNDDLTAISDLLLGQGFSNMDRVISFEEMNFNPQGEVQWNDANGTENRTVDRGA